MASVQGQGPFRAGAQRYHFRRREKWAQERVRKSKFQNGKSIPPPNTVAMARTTSGADMSHEESLGRRPRWSAQAGPARRLPRARH